MPDLFRYYRHYIVPDDFTPTADSVVELENVCNSILAGNRYAAEGTPTMHCAYSCATFGCDRCIRGIFHFNQWADLAKLDAYESFLREAHVLVDTQYDTNNYHRRPISIEGVTVPNGISSGMADNIMYLFNRESERWCTGIDCNGVSCSDCIYCASGDAELKRSCFAKYARACGYTVRLNIPDTLSEDIRSALVEGPPVRTFTVNTAAVTDTVQPTQQIMPIQSSWVNSLRMFNSGFACWCDPRQGRCPSSDNCSNCLCSTSNPGAVLKFAEWAKSQGLDVNRAEVENRYQIPEHPPEIVIDCSMTSDNFDNPMVMPRLRPGDYIRIAHPVEFTTTSGLKTHWVQLVDDWRGTRRYGRDVFVIHGLAVAGLTSEGALIDPVAEEVADGQGTVAMALGYIYTVLGDKEDIAVGSYCVNVSDIVEVCRFLYNANGGNNALSCLDILRHMHSSSRSLVWESANK